MQIDGLRREPGPTGRRMAGHVLTGHDIIYPVARHLIMVCIHGPSRVGRPATGPGTGGCQSAGNARSLPGAVSTTSEAGPTINGSGRPTRAVSLFV
jgi:hypothetical protein